MSRWMLGALGACGAVGMIAIAACGGCSHSGSRYDPTEAEMLALSGLFDNFRFDCGRYPTTQEGLDALLKCPKGLERKWRGPYADAGLPRAPDGKPYLYRALSGRYELSVSQ